MSRRLRKFRKAEQNVSLICWARILEQAQCDRPDAEFQNDISPSLRWILCTDNNITYPSVSVECISRICSKRPVCTPIPGLSHRATSKNDMSLSRLFEELLHSPFKSQLWTWVAWIEEQNRKLIYAIPDCELGVSRLPLGLWRTVAIPKGTIDSHWDDADWQMHVTCNAGRGGRASSVMAPHWWNSFPMECTVLQIYTHIPSKSLSTLSTLNKVPRILWGKSWLLKVI